MRLINFTIQLLIQINKTYADLKIDGFLAYTWVKFLKISFLTYY